MHPNTVFMWLQLEFHVKAGRGTWTVVLAWLKLKYRVVVETFLNLMCIPVLIPTLKKKKKCVLTRSRCETPGLVEIVYHNKS